MNLPAKTFTVRARDSKNGSATKSLTITVYTLPSITTTSLVNGVTGTAYSQTLAATGGKTAYSWSISGGTLPAGLSLNATTGAITGTPTAAGTSSITFQVADSNGKTATKVFSITINAALAVATTTLPDGYLTSAYSATVTASGGTSPYTWSITGGALPAGLTLATGTGVISGTPTSTGTSTFTVQAKDAVNATTSKSLTITVYALPAISTTSLPNGAVGTAYDQTLTVTGGKAPYGWSITGGALPAGLTLDGATGAITGTPTVAGTSSITFQAADANGKTATKVLSITINAALAVDTATMPDGYLTSTYSATVTASGGTSPYTWSIIGGTLPAGLTLAADNVISGTPTATGTSTFTVQARDAINAAATKSLSITVYTLPTISTAGLSNGAVSTAYTQTWQPPAARPPTPGASPVAPCLLASPWQPAPVSSAALRPPQAPAASPSKPPMPTVRPRPNRSA